MPSVTVSEVGLIGEAILGGDAICRDVKVEVLGHPAVAVGEFGDPIAFAVAGVGEAGSIIDGGTLADVGSHFLHVADAVKGGDIGRVGDDRDGDGVSVGAGGERGVDFGSEGEIVSVGGAGRGAGVGGGAVGGNLGSTRLGGGDGLVGGAIVGSSLAKVVTPSIRLKSRGCDARCTAINGLDGGRDVGVDAV